MRAGSCATIALILALIATVRSARAADDLCQSAALVSSQLSQAESVADPLRKYQALKTLALALGACKAPPPATAEVFHRAIVFASETPTARLHSERDFIWWGLSAAAANRRPDWFIDEAKPWLAYHLVDSETPTVLAVLEQSIAAEVRAGASRPDTALTRETIFKLGTLSPSLCRLIASRASDKKTGPDTELEYLALRCTLNFGFKAEAESVVRRLGGSLSSLSGDDFSGVAKRLLAYTVAIGDEGLMLDALRQVEAVRVGHGLATDGPLTLAEVSTLSEFHRFDEADAKLADCPARLKTCVVAAAVLSLERGEPAGATTLLPYLHDKALADDPSLAYPAYHLVAGATRELDPHLLRISADFGGMALPGLLRDCALERASLARELMLYAGSLRPDDHNAVLACAARALPAFSGEEVVAVTPSIDRVLASDPLPRTVAYRLRVARVLLLNWQEGDSIAPQLAAEAILGPILSAPEESGVDPSQLDAALKLELRIRLDTHNAQAATTASDRLKKRGVAIPPSLQEVTQKVPVVLPAIDQQFGVQFTSIPIPGDVYPNGSDGRAYFQNLAIDRATTAKQKAKTVEGEMGGIATFADQKSTIATDLHVDEGCLTQLFDQRREKLKLLSDTENAAVNAQSPTADAVHRHMLSDVAVWKTETERQALLSDQGIEVRRESRTVEEAIQDLSVDVVVDAKFGQFKAALATEAELDRLQAAHFPTDTAWYCSGASDELRHAGATVRAALLAALASHESTLSNDQAWRLLAHALRPDSWGGAIVADGAPRKDYAGYYELKSQERTAVENLDVEAFRSLQSAELNLDKSAPVFQGASQSRDDFMNRLGSLRASLHGDEAIVAWPDPPIGFPSVIVVIRRTDFQVVPMNQSDPSEFSRKIDELEEEAKLPESGRPEQLKPFNVELAHNIYAESLGLANLQGLRRLFFVGDSPPIPLSLLVIKAGRGPSVDVTYATTVWFVDNYNVAYLGGSLALPRYDANAMPNSGKPVIFTPDYGLYGNTPKYTSCGLHPLGEFGDGLIGAGGANSIVLESGSNATKEKLFELDRERVLSATSLLIFYAHGLSIEPRDGGGKEPAIALTPNPDCDQFGIAGRVTDGLLTEDEVAALRVRQAWVVLAGCGTGGEDSSIRSSLVDAFLSAGAAGVVGSTGDVPADSTAEFVRKIFLPTRTGGDMTDRVGAGIRAVKNHEGPGGARTWGHPAYWASWLLMTP